LCLTQLVIKGNRAVRGMTRSGVPTTSLRNPTQPVSRRSLRLPSSRQLRGVIAARAHRRADCAVTPVRAAACDSECDRSTANRSGARVAVGARRVRPANRRQPYPYRHGRCENNRYRTNRITCVPPFRAIRTTLAAGGRIVITRIDRTGDRRARRQLPAGARARRPLSSDAARLPHRAAPTRSVPSRCGRAARCGAAAGVPGHPD
jgi:hypothetical protein